MKENKKQSVKCNILKPFLVFFLFFFSLQDSTGKASRRNSTSHGNNGFIFYNEKVRKLGCVKAGPVIYCSGRKKPVKSQW